MTDDWGKHEITQFVSLVERNTLGILHKHGPFEELDYNLIESRRHSFGSPSPFSRHFIFYPHNNVSISNPPGLLASTLYITYPLFHYPLCQYLNRFYPTLRVRSIAPYFFSLTAFVFSIFYNVSSTPTPRLSIHSTCFNRVSTLPYRMMFMLFGRCHFGVTDFRICLHAHSLWVHQQFSSFFRGIV